MKYAVDMGSGGMLHIPSFINIGSGRAFTDTESAW
jgi:hypothetical protein